MLREDARQQKHDARLGAVYLCSIYLPIVLMVFALAVK